MSHLTWAIGYTILFLASLTISSGKSVMSSPFDFDFRIDELDRIIDSLKDLEESLRGIVERFESMPLRMLASSEEDDSQVGWLENRQRLRKRGDEKGVFLISEKKTMLITGENLPRVLFSNLNRLVEYKIDTVDEMSALERLLSTLEKKKRLGK
jgi:hypothetical protein